MVFIFFGTDSKSPNKGRQKDVFLACLNATLTHSKNASAAGVNFSNESERATRVS